MSLRRKTELAFKALLLAGRPAPVDPPIAAVTAQILTGYENQTKTKLTQRVVINAISGPPVSPKSRNIRMRVEILVETSADLQEADDTETEQDETTPEESHAALTKQVHQIIDTSNLVARLQALGGQSFQVGETVYQIGDFTCFGIVPLGELEVPPRPQSRVFRDAWGYRATVAECIAT